MVLISSLHKKIQPEPVGAMWSLAWALPSLQGNVENRITDGRCLDVIRGNVKKISSGFSLRCPTTQWLFTHTTGSLINKSKTRHFTFIVRKCVSICVCVRVCVTYPRPLARGTFCAAVFTRRALSCPSNARKIPWILFPLSHTHAQIHTHWFPRNRSRSSGSRSSAKLLNTLKPTSPLFTASLIHEPSLFTSLPLSSVLPFTHHSSLSISLPKYPFCLDTGHIIRPALCWLHGPWYSQPRLASPP